MNFAVSEQEKRLIKDIFAKANTQDYHYITRDHANEVFAGFGEIHGETKAEIERFKHGTMLVNEELVVARRQLVNGESDRIQVLVDMDNAKKEFENAQGELESTNRKIAAKVLHRSTISTRPSTLPLGTTLASQLNMLLSGSDNIVQRRLVSDDRNCDHLSQGEKNPVGDSETEEGDAGPQTQNAGRGSLDFAAELLNIGGGDNVAYVTVLITSISVAHSDTCPK